MGGHIIPLLADTATAQQQPSLRRVLGLWNLVFIGIILIQPTAPMPLFGVVSNKAGGHVATTILIALCAMLFTAISYGRMARAYPLAGSAYTYVGHEIHPALGFITGWSMLMDYVLNPVICTVWCGKAMANIVSGVPQYAWVIFFALLFTGMNLRSIHTTARINFALTMTMGAVIVWVLVAAGLYVAGLPGITLSFFTRPFYDPSTFSVRAVSAGTSLAVLTYIGFDGLSTLSEEVKDPHRNILRGIVLTCLIIGVLSTIEVYAGQLVWPASEPFPDADTAYVHMAGRAGGWVLFQVVNLTLLVASLGSGSGGQLAGARLLFGMGRDNAIPRKFFGQVDQRRGIPRNAVVFIGVFVAIGGLLLTYELGAELLNFGALLGFMGVNLSALFRYWIRAEHRRWTNLLPPVIGFVVCLYIWLSLSWFAKTVGAIWLATGLIYGAYKTRGFRTGLIRFDSVD